MGFVKEHVNFTNSTYWTFMSQGVMDGTANAQVLGAGDQIAQKNPNAPQIYVEPEAAATILTPGPVKRERLDRMNRLVVMAQRQSGIAGNQPNAELRFTREGQTKAAATSPANPWQLVVDFAIPIPANPGVHFVVDPLFPTEWGKDPAGGAFALSNNLLCDLIVNVTDSTAHVIMCQCLLLQAYSGRGGRRAAVESKLAYY